MIPTIQKSDRFQQDYKRYKSAIDNIKNDKFKLEAESLLNKLVNEVQSLDNMHTDIIMNKQVTSIGTEYRDRIISLRKQLDNKLRDFFEADQA
jgi:hypothetical protein